MFFYSLISFNFKGLMEMKILTRANSNYEIESKFLLLNDKFHRTQLSRSEGATATGADRGRSWRRLWIHQKRRRPSQKQKLFALFCREHTEQRRRQINLHTIKRDETRNVTKSPEPGRQSVQLLKRRQNQTTTQPLEPPGYILSLLLERRWRQKDSVLLTVSR